jgi:hypothetical protein
MSPFLFALLFTTFFFGVLFVVAWLELPHAKKL